MTRNLKALGLALVAVFALSAMAVQVASAHTFTAEKAPVTLHGTQENTQVLSFTGKSMECNRITYHGTLASNSAAVLTLHPTYSACNFGGIEMGVHVPANCNMVFGSNTPSANMAPVSFECEHGEPIRLDIGEICTLTIGDTHPPATTTVNQNFNGVHYTNIGTGTTREITVDETIENITVTAEGSLCFLAGILTGTHANATAIGKATFTGTEDSGSGHVGVFFDAT